MICFRRSGVMGPIWLAGGQTSARWTMPGVPLSSRKDTKASPTASWVMTVAVSSLGLVRKVSAADFDGFLVVGREGAEGVLHAIAELAEDDLRDVVRVLRDEVDADALGADEADDLLDARAEGGGQIVEEQVRFVEEEDELGLFSIADFGHALEELRQQPQQESGIELRRLHQLVGGEDVDDSMAVLVGLQQVVDVERGLAKEFVAALLLERDQIALDGADAGRRDVAVLRSVLRRVIADVLQHGAQVFQVEQQKSLVVGDLEDEGEDSGLRVIEIEDAAEQAADPFQRRWRERDGPARRRRPRR